MLKPHGHRLVIAAILVSLPSFGAPEEDRWSSDGIWRATSAATQPRAELEAWIRPDRFQFVELDPQTLVNALNRAPKESGPQATASSFVMTLPMPDGTFARFDVVESPIMELALAERFPEIRTYLGRDIDDRAASVRFDWTPFGFHAQILSPAGTVYIDPLWRGDVTAYASYYKRDYHKGAGGFQCLGPTDRRATDVPSEGSIAAALTGETLRTYRLACAATGEYTAFFGGTVTDGLSAIVTAINRVNGIYETEVAVRMILVADNDLIVYTDGRSDPYTNGDGFSMLGQNQSNLNSTIGSANYDIGHVLSTGGGGIAGFAVVCRFGNKARGVTGSSNPVGDGFWVDYVAHEMGHQFGADHSFNGITGSCGGGNRWGPTAYEPGSGSTIMAYAGICGPDDLQAHSDPFFHSVSFDEIRSYTQAGSGNSCAAQTATGNSPPTVNAGPDYTIPRNTPFAVTVAESDDPDGDPLTYCWEQRDLGPGQTLSAADNGTSPILRSWNPAPDPARIIPRLPNLLSNSLPVGEKYPAVNRTMDLRVTVRDNRAGGGGVASDDMVVTVSASAGPFQVTQPNTSVSLRGFAAVKWNVANTDLPPVNAETVDVFLSTDGGMTFPTALLLGTPNDGSELVPLSSIDTTTARIKVRGSDNIFFDVSNVDFTIEPCGSVTAPSAETTPVVKNRYLTCSLDNLTGFTALRVTLVDLPVPFSSFNGQARWVGPPQSSTETQSPLTTFTAAGLQCEPYFTDWSALGTLQIYGAEIVPNAEYEIQSVACDPNDEAGFSAPLTVRTAAWGDIVEPFNPPSTTQQPDFGDVSAVVNKFKEVDGSPIKARTQLHPNLPDPSVPVDFADISACVDAFKGFPYPYPGPTDCP